MITYSIKLGFLKRIKNVKAHLFPKDLPPNIMLVIEADETRHYVNTERYKHIKFSKELYANIQEAMAKESGNLKN